MNAKKSFSNAHEKAFEKDLFVSFFNRELQSEELIDKLVQHGVFRFGEQIFDRSVFGHEILQYGGECFQQRRTCGFLGETDDGFRSVEENFDISDGGRFQKINGKLENGDVILVFRHFSDGGGGEALAVLVEIEIMRGSVHGEGNRDGFDRRIKGCFHDISQQTEGDLFDTARKVCVKKRERNGKQAHVFSVNTEGFVDDGHKGGAFLHFFLSGLRLGQCQRSIQRAQYTVCVA